VSHFKNDAKKWAEPSIDKSNIINIKKTGSLNGKVLMIYLDKDANHIIETSGDSRNIPPDSILNKNNFSLIGKHNGPVLLYSADPGLSARIWMLLSQMGRRNIYILTDSTDNEILKYKFRPDSLMN
jgi:rhodanese-related sulfurtransferase